TKTCHKGAADVVLESVQPEEMALDPSQAGDGRADAPVEALFREHYTRIVGMLARLTGDRGHAEEIAADVFHKLSQRPAMMAGAGRDQAGESGSGFRTPLPGVLRSSSMTNCWSEGALRACLDRELTADEMEAVGAHLCECSACDALYAEFAARAARVSELMEG